MEPTLIKKSVADIEHQFLFLLSIENRFRYRKHRQVVIILVGITITYLYLIFFTGPEILVTLKALASILFGLMWISGLVYGTWFLIKFWNRRRWIKGLIKERLTEKKDYFLLFNDQKLTIQTKDLKLELEWNYFKAYLESNLAIFLFPEGSLYSALSFSSNEIGEQNYLQLKELVRKSLAPLKTVSG